MNDSQGAAGNRDSLIESFAADLTDVAYQVALRHGAGDKWLELEVDLWGAMTEAVEKRSCVDPMD